MRTPRLPLQGQSTRARQILGAWTIGLSLFLLQGLLLGQASAQTAAPPATATNAANAPIPNNATTPAPTFTHYDEALKAINSDDLIQKQAAIQALTSFNSPATEAILTALIEGKLFASQGVLYIAQGDDKTTDKAKSYQQATDPKRVVTELTGVKKVTINNTIRNWGKQYLAENALKSSDPVKRKNALLQVMDKSDDKIRAQVQMLLPQETDKTVQSLMQIYLAKGDLFSNDATVQSQAIDTLARTTDMASKSALESYISRNPDAALKAKAVRAMQDIDRRLSWMNTIEMATFGLSLGSVLVLAAIGLSITFGVMGVINMAHGELMMIGAYCAYIVQLLMPNWIEGSLLVAIPVAFIVCAIVGVLIERLVVRHLYGRPLETLLATFGVSLILQQAVRSIFSPLNRMVQSPTWMSGSWEITAGLSVTWNRVYIVIFCVVCFFALLAIMKKTRLGLEVNAVSQNRAMARAMGISDKKVDMLTFGLGSGVAGLAGVALSQITNVGPNLGQAYITDSFMVVVVGGVGNLWGTLLSGLGLGALNKVFEPMLGAVLAKTLVLVLIILFIQKFPRGLFPQKGRAVE